MKSAVNILLFISLSLLVSCKLSKIDKCERITNNYKAEMMRAGCAAFVPDTVFTSKTEVRYRDTVIYIKLQGETRTDTLKVFVKNGLISSNVSTLQNKYAKSDAWVDSGVLRHNLTAKDTTIAMRLESALKVINYYETLKIKEAKPVIVEKEIKKPVPFFLKFLMYSGIVFWGLVILFIIIKFTTIKIPFLR